MEQDPVFERLWRGEAAMEAWTATVSGGVAVPIADDAIAIHTGYVFGNASAFRTGDGLVLVDTGSRETAHQMIAALRHWDDGPVHTVIYTHGHIDHTWGARISRSGGRREGDCAAAHHRTPQCPATVRAL